MQSLSRKIIAVIIMANIALCANAQNIKQVVADGKQWACITEQPGYEPESSLYEFDGNIAINGIVYKRLMKNGEFNAALRQEGKKVYIWSDEEERLLYDFDMKIGDTFTYVEDCSLVLLAADTINIAGVPVRRMKFVSEEDIPYINTNVNIDENNGMAECWVEGIGAIHGPANPMGWCVIGDITHTEKCIYDNQVIFTFNEFLSATPTAISAQPKTIIQCGQQAYDLQGRKMQQPPQKGIYIKNGRKYVVK